MAGVHGEEIQLNCLSQCGKKFDGAESLKSHLLMACRYVCTRQPDQQQIKPDPELVYEDSISEIHN